MRPQLAPIAWTLALFLLHSAEAGGLHLGMKLACKRYGDAWSTGSASALYGAATWEFASQWNRMPPEIFASLPRGGGGAVMGSFKQRGGYGEVTVSTPQGVMTFVLVGKGFHWRVADIYRHTDEGQWVSMANYLDASLTAREFMASLQTPNDERFRYQASAAFTSAVHSLGETDLVRVRKVLPPPCLNCKPHLVFQGYYANLTVCPPDGQPGDQVHIRLVNQGGWKVDDFAIRTAKMQIASFQKSMPALACVSALGEFVNSPRVVDPAGFTPDGELRAALQYARTLDPFPMQGGEVRKLLEVSDDGRTVSIQYPSRAVRLTLTQAIRPQVERIEMSAQPGVWSDVAVALAVQKKVKEFSFGSLAQLPIAKDPRAATIASVLKNASAVERIVDKTAIAAAVPAPSPATGKLPEPKRLDVAPMETAAPSAPVHAESQVAAAPTAAEPVTVAVKSEEPAAAAASAPLPPPSTARSVVDPVVQPASYSIQPQPTQQFYQPRPVRRFLFGRRR